jgi:hypothetical protein
MSYCFHLKLSLQWLADEDQQLFNMYIINSNTQRSAFIFNDLQLTHIFQHFSYQPRTTTHLPQFVLPTNDKRTKCHFIQVVSFNLLRHTVTSSFVFTVPEFQDSGQWLLCVTQYMVQCTMMVAFPSIALLTIIVPCNELIM